MRRRLDVDLSPVSSNEVKKSGAAPPFVLYVVMAWTGTSLPTSTFAMPITLFMFLNCFIDKLQISRSSFQTCESIQCDRSGGCYEFAPSLFVKVGYLEFSRGVSEGYLEFLKGI
jgi:hypothetical protein